MGSLVNTIKRFLGNKNTVTIIAVLAGIIILWYFYNYRVDQAITTISIPYAVEAIDTGKKIESDNIKYREVNSAAIKNTDIVTDVSYLTDKYICYGTSTPKDGFFYKSQICRHEELKNTIFEDIPEGYTVYTLDVDSKLTYANSILPGDVIDLYVQATDDDGQIIYGPLINSIKVLAVRDYSGLDVFWDSMAGDTAFLLFAVPNDYHKLLNVAELVNVKTVPVPRNASYTQNPGETEIASQQLYDFIMNKAAEIVDVDF